MKNLEELLPILIILIGLLNVIFKAFSKKKGKDEPVKPTRSVSRKTAPPVSTAPSQEDQWWLEEVFGIPATEKQPVPVAEKQSPIKSIPNKKPVVKESLQTQRDNMRKADGPSFSAASKTKKSDEMMKPMEKMKVESVHSAAAGSMGRLFQNREDLKRAVVMKEILSRKFD
ncbi:MAG: hypothetical protein RR202_03880 [Bacteroidales bacterium]